MHGDDHLYYKQPTVKVRLAKTFLVIFLSAGIAMIIWFLIDSGQRSLVELRADMDAKHEVLAENQHVMLKDVENVQAITRGTLLVVIGSGSVIDKRLAAIEQAIMDLRTRKPVLPAPNFNNLHYPMQWALQSPCPKGVCW